MLEEVASLLIGYIADKPLCLLLAGLVGILWRMYQIKDTQLNRMTQAMLERSHRLEQIADARAETLLAHALENKERAGDH